MKVAITLLFLFAGTSANACLDISGTYTKNTDGTVDRVNTTTYVQTGCSKLLQIDTLEGYGTVKSYTHTLLIGDKTSFENGSVDVYIKPVGETSFEFTVSFYVTDKPIVTKEIVKMDKDGNMKVTSSVCRNPGAQNEIWGENKSYTLLKIK